jgi:hypothetical protein
MPDFESGAFNHSATLPAVFCQILALGSLAKDLICQLDPLRTERRSFCSRPGGWQAHSPLIPRARSNIRIFACDAETRRLFDEDERAKAEKRWRGN